MKIHTYFDNDPADNVPENNQKPVTAFFVIYGPPRGRNRKT